MLPSNRPPGLIAKTLPALVIALAVMARPTSGQVTTLFRVDGTPRGGKSAAAKKPGALAPEPLAGVFPALARGARYVGSAACLPCHLDTGGANRPNLWGRYQGSRAILDPRRRGCEGCHGPGSLHVERPSRPVVDPGKLVPEKQEALCLSCHALKQALRDPDEHYPGHSGARIGCLGCHRVHRSHGGAYLRNEPNRLCAGCHGEVAAQFTLRSRHPLRMEGMQTTFSNREGKVSCVDCHRGTYGDPGSLGTGENQGRCVTCHPDTRGPFLYPHDAGSRELAGGCLACHLPHGSPNRNLLKIHDRGLCLSCHLDRAVDHFPAPSCTTSACHSQIHGSNRDPLFLGR